MNSKVYKWCAVPQCKNTSIVTPNKVFVHVPCKKIIRDKWLKLARRNPRDVVTNSPLYFCEEHFDLPNDMVNYMEYHVMGSVSQVRMKPGCMPTKFICQTNRKTRTSDTTKRPYIAKKRKMMILEECEKQYEEKNQQNFEEVPLLTPRVVRKSTQEPICKKLRSKASKTKDSSAHQMTSPVKPHSVCTSTSKIKQSDSDTFNTATHTESSISVKSLQMESTSGCSEMIEYDKGREDLNTFDCTLKKIKNSPHSYIGIPFSSYYLVNLIQEETNIPLDHILLCLKKIRFNKSFSELADDFGIDKSYPKNIFFKNIPIIASVMRPFIVTSDNKSIKKNLPMAFRHNQYNKVTCIIDCLEIEVQKPSKALNQALSWSEYKKAHTIKYLISCTPNGLVNYISNGYGGRLTDTSIVEMSDLIKCLQPNMSWVMADRGFKHVEVYLQKVGVLLVRPPSVVSEAKLTKAEAEETKRIACLRIHFERVIGQLHEFNMLKPHACLNLDLVKVLDDVITIACGLINIDSLVK